jgi:hypothetical protein
VVTTSSTSRTPPTVNSGRSDSPFLRTHGITENKENHVEPQTGLMIATPRQRMMFNSTNEVSRTY